MNANSNTNATKSNPNVNANNDKETTTMNANSNSNATTTNANLNTSNGKETPTMNINANANSIVPTTTITAGGATAPSPIFITPPPASANIPSPPPGFVPTKGHGYRGSIPKAAELVALSGAIEDIRSFADWVPTLGKTADPQDQVAQALDGAGQWSNMRNVTAAWDTYCREEAGMAWKTVRFIISRLRPAFELAAQSDPTLITRYPKLAAFLAAKQTIARASAATKKANQDAKAAGQPQFHGTVGKKRKAAAEKAALAVQSATAHPPAAPPQPAVSSVVTPPQAPPNVAPANGATHS